MNSLRFPETPLHYQTEAARLTHEVDLWERWTQSRGEEDGFQEWLDEPFGGQPHEDASGGLTPASAQTSSRARREVLLWNYDEVAAELEAFLLTSE
jgi:hypothetical protein